MLDSPAMTLDQYLTQVGMSNPVFAGQLDVTPECVRAWRRGIRRPRREHLQRINEITLGAVTPDDFFLPEAERA